MHLQVSREKEGSMTEWICPLLPLWQEIRQQLRRRISIMDFQLWANESQPLRMMQGPRVMFTEIPAYYMERRRVNGVPTVMDFALLQTWANAGIFPGAITRGIAEVFEQKLDAHPGDSIFRQVNSLKYFAQPILRAAANMKEAAVGRGWEPGKQKPEWTLLLGLPRNGRAIYKALAAQGKLQLAAQSICPALGVALTVIPDAWQKSQIRDFLEDGK